MKSILTLTERDRLSAQVAQIEEHTASEIVTVVLSKSDDYAAYRIGYAAGLALTLTCIGHLVMPALSAMALLGAQALLACILYSLLGLPACLRWFVPRWAKERAVERRVRELFVELGVTETRDRSGVLIYLSEFERRIQILGDRGVHSQLGQDAWSSLVQELVTYLRDGRAAEGLTRIIERLGKELQAHFPARPDDTNELPNAVVTDRP